MNSTQTEVNQIEHVHIQFTDLIEATKIAVANTTSQRNQQPTKVTEYSFKA